jgi:hypothetical protein
MARMRTRKSGLRLKTRASGFRLPPQLYLRAMAMPSRIGLRNDSSVGKVAEFNLTRRKPFPQAMNREHESF